MIYTVYLEPIATDAISFPAKSSLSKEISTAKTAIRSTRFAALIFSGIPPIPC